MRAGRSSRKGSKEGQKDKHMYGYDNRYNHIDTWGVSVPTALDSSVEEGWEDGNDDIHTLWGASVHIPSDDSAQPAQLNEVRVTRQAGVHTTQFAAPRQPFHPSLQYRSDYSTFPSSRDGRYNSQQTFSPGPISLVGPAQVIVATNNWVNAAEQAFYELYGVNSPQSAVFHIGWNLRETLSIIAGARMLPPYCAQGTLNGNVEGLLSLTPQYAAEFAFALMQRAALSSSGYPAAMTMLPLPNSRASRRMLGSNTTNGTPQAAHSTGQGQSEPVINSGPSRGYQSRHTPQMSAQHNDKPALCNEFVETGSCPNRPKCQHAHGQAELRLHPKYKTTLCDKFMEHGSCPYDKNCQFAHGEEELKTIDEEEVRSFLARKPKYKTQLCRRYWGTGKCDYGRLCLFIHPDDVDAIEEAKREGKIPPFSDSNEE